MSREKSEPTDLQSWDDPGQNRESGGSTAEKTPYAAEGGPADPTD